MRLTWIIKDNLLFLLKFLIPKTPIVSAKQAIKAFSKLGFTIVSQKGSHIKIKNEKGQTVIIPNHKQIKKGTLKKGILKPLNISVEDFIKLL